MHVLFGEGKQHSEKLKHGLEVLGSNFVARICWCCDGTTDKRPEFGFGSCERCSNNGYATGLGLLINGKPAPVSVVNQVLIAAERDINS